MNETAKQAFELLIKQLLDSVSEAKGFVKEHAPDVVKELIRYKTIMVAYDSLCTLIIGGVFAGAVFLLCYYFPDEFIRSDGTVRTGPPLFFKMLFLSADALVVTICMLCNINELIKLQAAPKLFVLEYANQLRKSEDE